MPAPFAQPSRRTSLPRMRIFSAAHFGRVSVVIIARVKERKEFCARDLVAAKSGTARKIFSVRMGSPITPVEQTKISSGAQLSARAAAAAVARDAAMPASPVAQFAFPEFTIMPRMRPRLCRRLARERTTGAAWIRFWVNTAAVAARESLTIRPRSSPDFLSPQARAENENPLGRSRSVGFDFIRRVLARRFH